MAAELPSWIPARMFTVNETAELAHVSPRHIRRMMADGRLPYVRIGDAVRIRPEVVAALVGGA